MNDNLKLVSAKEVADYFIWKSNNSVPPRPITNKKLQKLVYYSQAWFLAIKSSVLFPEKIEAWVHGPVVRELYFNFRLFNSSPIVKEISFDLIDKIPSDIKKFLDDVWSIYGKFDSGYLETLTHSESPWQEAREGLAVDEISENEINIDSIKKYYSSKLKQVTQ